MGHSISAALLGALLAATVRADDGGGPVLPDGFELVEVVGALDRPVDLEFAGDGRMFVTQQNGIVWVIEDGERLAEPFIDLTEEVNAQSDRGMLGIALAPDFADTRRVYLLYTVDPIFGKPDEPSAVGTFGRLTSYTGTLASNGNVADCESRQVLIGETWSTGIPICDKTHTVGTVRVGHDGSILVSTGDGAHSERADPGGLDPECFGEGRFDADQDVGAFRSQFLGSLAGKVLRIDGATGLGLPGNPHWTGDGADVRSKVWVNGLRNPFRFALRPGTGPGPGTLYIGDVGWRDYEEISVAYGGENFGWPCREGFRAAPEYPNEEPAHSGCDSIETEENPGPLTDPILAWHHLEPGRSDPPGTVGRCVAGGAFYTGSAYPEVYRDRYFYLDQRSAWIRVAEVDAQDRLQGEMAFGDGINRAVDLEPDPFAGDLHVVHLEEGRITRISYEDRSCPCDPVELGFLDTPNRASGVAVSGGVAYVADHTSGLRVIDVSDPANPVELGFLDTPVLARGVAVSGGVAYVADHTSGLRVIDVSDPANPVELGFLDTPGYAFSVAVSGGVAYVADAGSGLRVIDVSDPANPVELGFLDTSNALGVAVSGGVAYVADNDSGLRVIDVSDPANPVELGFLDTPDRAIGVAVSGGVAYVADSGSGLRVIDVSDPANPVELGSLNTPDHAISVAVSGGVAYVPDGGSGLLVIDVSDPANPVEVGFLDTPVYAWDVAVSGGVAYVADRESGLRVIDASSCCVACSADLDGNRDVGFSDLLAILAAWGPCKGACPEDLDKNGDVGFSDLLIVLAAWGPCD